MSEHLSSQTLERYHQRELSLSETRVLDDHLAECADCRRRLLPPSFVREALFRFQTELQQAAPEGEHLTDDELADLAGGRLDEISRELFEDHLVACDDCSARWREVRPAPLVSRHWQEKVWAFFGKTRLSWQIAGAAAALALLILGLSYWRGARKREEQIVVAPPSVSPAVVPSVTSQSPAPRLLAFNDGGARITFDEAGTLTGYDNVSPADRQLISQALRTRYVEMGFPAELTKSPGGTRRGNDEEKTIELIGPNGRVLLSDRPMLQWEKLTEVEVDAYNVKIIDFERQETVAASPPLTTSQWEPAIPLPRGRIYSWQVSAFSQGKRVGSSFTGSDARFKVLEQKKAGELARARQRYAGQHLVIGLLYARAGMLDEAEREFETLAKANPDSSLPNDLWRAFRAGRPPVQDRRR